MDRGSRWREGDEMTTTKLHKYITIAELLVKLGEPNDEAARRRLIRRIRARERALGVSILEQDQPGEPGSPLRTTMAWIRKYMPKVVERDREIVSELARRLSALEDSLLECRLRENALASRVRSLENQHGQAA